MSFLGITAVPKATTPLHLKVTHPPEKVTDVFPSPKPLIRRAFLRLTSKRLKPLPTSNCAVDNGDKIRKSPSSKSGPDFG
jgi:hypothetical protein